MRSQRDRRERSPNAEGNGSSAPCVQQTQSTAWKRCPSQRLRSPVQSRVGEETYSRVSDAQVGENHKLARDMSDKLATPYGEFTQSPKVTRTHNWSKELLKSTVGRVSSARTFEFDSLHGLYMFVPRTTDSNITVWFTRASVRNKSASKQFMLVLQKMTKRSKYHHVPPREFRKVLDKQEKTLSRSREQKRIWQLVICFFKKTNRGETRTLS